MLRRKGAIKKGDYTRAFEFGQGLLIWGMRRHILNCHFCIVAERVLRRIRERKFNIWSRLLLVVIPKLDTILESMNGTMIILREQ